MTTRHLKTSVVDLRRRPDRRERMERVLPANGVSHDAAVMISGMVKRYGERTAVDGLSLTAARGEVTAILGPNGAGKTSTIETCEGYRRADGGIVRVLGLDPVADGGKLRPRVGVMLQS